MEEKNALTFIELITNPQLNNVESDVSVKCQIDNKIQELRRLTTENKAAVEPFRTKFIDDFQQFDQLQQRIQELNDVPSTTEIEDQKRVWMDEVNRIRSNIDQQCGQILVSIQTVFNLLNETQQILIDKRLTKWKYDQILAGFGDKNIKTETDSHNKNPQLRSALDDIQTQFEGLYECASGTMSVLGIIHECYGQLNCVDSLEAKASSDITNMLQKLVQSSFVVDQQPPQVITEGTRFEASVRVLLPEYIAIAQNPAEVMVSFLSESQTSQQHQQQRPENLNSGKIDMEKCCFEISPSNDQRLECHLNKMKLTNIKRNSERGTNKSVMDEKFCLLFETDLQMLEPINLSVRVWTMSVPVTVASNVNQKRNGWATIAWDNAFFEIGRTLFAVPTQVPWSHIKWALQMIFHYQTGCDLTDEHLQSLYEEVFGASPVPDQDPLMSWEQFGKDKMPARTDFTFFTWFYEATQLTRVHLSKEWQNGLIAGFISKDKATEELLKCEPGTFLLRFSDSASGISVAWVQLNAYGTKEVQHMQPFVHADFENKEDDKKFRSISDLIKNHHKCTHLYPGMIPKYKAFAEYFTQPNATKKGYVPKQYSFLAPPEENEVSSSSSPSSSSPSSFCPSSPFPSPSFSSFFSLNSTQNRQSPSPYPLLYPNATKKGYVQKQSSLEENATSSCSSPSSSSPNIPQNWQLPPPYPTQYSLPNLSSDDIVNDIIQYFEQPLDTEF
ncbi:signal transducer and transcription activator-like [Sitodiplosis mosellana]|uniref:signal transducer and transcription activator-like n=1 Tax=Sitodiplosis mosellana TaxID=263140 RepID=UPI0024447EC3|nr:signal transducer and transcription activator-like [Sitodiplosis mosellana]